MASKSGVSLHWGGLDKAMGKAGRALADRQALLVSCGEALVSGTLQRFKDEENPQGKKWPVSHRAKQEDGVTLTDTARLQRSIDYATTNDKVMVGSNVAYARIHQLGGKAGRGRKVTIPDRPYLGVSNADRAEIRATLADFLAGAFKVGLRG